MANFFSHLVIYGEIGLTNELLERIEEIRLLARELQDPQINYDQNARIELSERINKDYMHWYRQCLSKLAKQGVPTNKFAECYDGSFLRQGIKDFLKLGWKLYPYHKEGGFLPRWTCDYAIFDRLTNEQINILFAAGLIEDYE